MIHGKQVLYEEVLKMYTSVVEAKKSIFIEEYEF